MTPAEPVRLALAGSGPGGGSPWTFSKLALTAALSFALAHGAVAEDAPAVTDPRRPRRGGRRAPAPRPRRLRRRRRRGSPAVAAVEAGVHGRGARADAPPTRPPEALRPRPRRDRRGCAGRGRRRSRAHPRDARPPSPRPRRSRTGHEVELGPVGHDAQGRPGRIHVVQQGRHALGHLRRLPGHALGVAVGLEGQRRGQESPSDLPGRPDLDQPVRDAEGQRGRGRGAAGARRAPRAATAAPAALAETDAMPPTRSLGSYHYPEIDSTGFVTREQYEGAGTILDSAAPRKMLTDGTEVVIGFGAGEVQVGDQFEIFRTEARVTDLDTGLHYGWATNQLGWLEVTRVDEESARAIVRMSRYGDPAGRPAAAAPRALDGHPDRRIARARRGPRGPHARSAPADGADGGGLPRSRHEGRPRRRQSGRDLPLLSASTARRWTRRSTRSAASRITWSRSCWWWTSTTTPRWRW